ncbi:MAG: LysE/ArgO family amino acid transporter [Proteobacteria bacterium]|nr:LysE/ArgO family amino acid transporter [Pseudomonadota bacterium]MBU1140861.1 LysE/ArgO family amino acid transporter [Pseudomonadota bacterium]MBU1231881.1 LysE/ArgO family amino acid transporter [Pseudomonadota bacterium]MBU1418499.1 LysE/ArgO family amino acid transporter [Pseudomonadota bacterium]MBU1454870.1 LysE/ArgO family amino acid transporter [Pseudomonadota bacterium]
MFLVFLKGFGIGGGLIVAIGAQNAFVLSQGIKKNHYIIIPLICCLCDIILIAIGIMGVGAAVAANHLLSQIATFGGALFLFWYGLNSFRSAFQGGVLKPEGELIPSFQSALLTTLAITLLNPHVYLDTVILLGGISGQFEGRKRLLFGAGAMAASVIWFFTLSLGGQLLAPLFRNITSWRILDSLVGLTMWTIAGSLLIHSL